MDYEMIADRVKRAYNNMKNKGGVGLLMQNTTPLVPISHRPRVVQSHLVAPADLLKECIKEVSEKHESSLDLLESSLRKDTPVKLLDEELHEAISKDQLFKSNNQAFMEKLVNSWKKGEFKQKLKEAGTTFPKKLSQDFVVFSGNRPLKKKKKQPIRAQSSHKLKRSILRQKSAEVEVMKVELEHPGQSPSVKSKKSRKGSYQHLKTSNLPEGRKPIMTSILSEDEQMINFPRSGFKTPNILKKKRRRNQKRFKSQDMIPDQPPLVIKHRMKRSSISSDRVSSKKSSRGKSKSSRSSKNSKTSKNSSCVTSRSFNHKEIDIFKKGGNLPGKKGIFFDSLSRKKIKTKSGESLRRRAQPKIALARASASYPLRLGTDPSIKSSNGQGGQLFQKLKGKKQRNIKTILSSNKISKNRVVEASTRSHPIKNSISFLERQKMIHSSKLFMKKRHTREPSKNSPQKLNLEESALSYSHQKLTKSAGNHTFGRGYTGSVGKNNIQIVSDNPGDKNLMIKRYLNQRINTPVSSLKFAKNKSPNIKACRETLKAALPPKIHIDISPMKQGRPQNDGENNPIHHSIPRNYNFYPQNHSRPLRVSSNLQRGPKERMQDITGNQHHLQQISGVLLPFSNQTQPMRVIQPQKRLTGEDFSFSKERDPASRAPRPIKGGQVFENDVVETNELLEKLRMVSANNQTFKSHRLTEPLAGPSRSAYKQIEGSRKSLQRNRQLEDRFQNLVDKTNKLCKELFSFKQSRIIRYQTQKWTA